MKRLMLIWLAIALIALLTTAGLLSKNRRWEEDAAELLAAPQLNSFSSITLHLIGMRFEHTYEILNTEAGAVLSRYNHIYKNGEDVRNLDQTVICDSDQILELLKTCGIVRWDGFHGAHPKNVTDGVMFTFTAVINDGQTIRAEGSENFPAGYHELLQTLNRLLAEQ